MQLRITTFSRNRRFRNDPFTDTSIRLHRHGDRIAHRPHRPALEKGTSVLLSECTVESWCERVFARLRRMRGQFLDGAIPVGTDSERGASAELRLRAVVCRRHGIQCMYGKGTVVVGAPEYVGVKTQRSGIN